MKAITLNTTSGTSLNSVFSSYLIKIIPALLLLLWCTGIFYPILFNNNIDHVVSTFLSHTYSIVCHQAEHKLISFEGSSTYLCARCTGIYVGALFMAVSLLFINFKTNFSLKLLIITSSIMLLDVISVSISLYNYISWISFTSGILFGAIIYIYLLQIFIKYFQSIIPLRN